MLVSMGLIFGGLCSGGLICGILRYVLMFSHLTGMVLKTYSRSQGALRSKVLHLFFKSSSYV